MEGAVRIVLACATKRGYLFLKKLVDMRPDSEFVVFSFPEERWEPRYLADIRGLTLASHGQFIEGKHLGSERHRPFWESTAVDLMLVVSWRYMIPARVYQKPQFGTFVFHDSLLPAYRGFAPTVWAIVNGEDHTGVTLFKIAQEVDAGDIVDQERVPIGPDDTISVVMDRVTDAYLSLLQRNLDSLLSGNVMCRKQDCSGATCTCKRLPEDNRINWTMPSTRIYNLIRAVGVPYPGAYSHLAGNRIRVWAAERIPGYPTYVGRIPGRVIEVRPGIGSVVLTGDGVLLLTLVQLDRGDPVCAADVLRSIGQTLGEA